MQLGSLTSPLIDRGSAAVDMLVVAFFWLAGPNVSARRGFELV